MPRAAILEFSSRDVVRPHDHAGRWAPGTARLDPDNGRGRAGPEPGEGTREKQKPGETVAFPRQPRESTVERLKESTSQEFQSFKSSETLQTTYHAETSVNKSVQRNRWFPQLSTPQAALLGHPRGSTAGFFKTMTKTGVMRRRVTSLYTSWYLAVCVFTDSIIPSPHTNPVAVLPSSCF